MAPGSAGVRSDPALAAAVASDGEAAAAGSGAAGGGLEGIVDGIPADLVGAYDQEDAAEDGERSDGTAGTLGGVDGAESDASASGASAEQPRARRAGEPASKRQREDAEEAAGQGQGDGEGAPPSKRAAGVGEAMRGDALVSPDRAAALALAKHDGLRVAMAQAVAACAAAAGRQERVAALAAGTMQVAAAAQRAQHGQGPVRERVLDLVSVVQRAAWGGEVAQEAHAARRIVDAALRA
uniref:Uncharacterized protein n=1 Tax=Cafeteria roenbergensis TaxID=33653 RepID=A0A7S0PBF1_CAFRO